MRAAQHRDLAEVAAQPVEDGRVLGVGHLAGAQLRLAQPQHRDAELLHHRVVVEHSCWSWRLTSRSSSAGSTRWCAATASTDRSPLSSGDRIGDRRVGGADLARGRAVPVDLAGHREEQLIDHVDPHVGGVDPHGRVAATPPPRRARSALKRSASSVARGNHELHRSATVGDVGVEVLGGEELGVVVDRDHRSTPSKAMPAYTFSCPDRVTVRRTPEPRVSALAGSRSTRPFLVVGDAALVEQVEIAGQLLAAVVAGRTGQAR